jgi:hypothetical protein
MNVEDEESDHGCLVGTVQNSGYKRQQALGNRQKLKANSQQLTANS